MSRILDEGDREQIVAPFKKRVAELETSVKELYELCCRAFEQRDEARSLLAEEELAYDRVYTDAQEGQRAAEEEIARLKAEKEQAEQALQDLALAVERKLSEARKPYADKIMELEAEVDQGVAEINRLNEEQDAAYARGILAGAKDDDESTPGATTLLPSWHGVPDPRPQIEEERRAEEMEAVDAALKANDPRGPHSEGCTLHWQHTGPCHVHCTTCDDRTGGCSDCSEGGGIVHEPEAKSAIEVPKPDKDEGEGMLIAYVQANDIHIGDRVRFHGTGNRFRTVIAKRRTAILSSVALLLRFPRYDAGSSEPYGDHEFTMDATAVVERDENERRTA